MKINKKITVLLLLEILLSAACNEKMRYVKYSNAVYPRSVLSYIELKEGMKLNLEGWTDYISDGFLINLVSHDENSCSFKYHIISQNGEKDFLLPGKLQLDEDKFPKYEAIYDQLRFDKIADSIGDTFNQRLKYEVNLTPGDLPTYDDLNIFPVVLYNQIDSMKLICTDKEIAGHPMNSSLNNIVQIDFGQLEPVINGLNPKPITCLIQDLHQTLKNNKRFFCVYSSILKSNLESGGGAMIRNCIPPFLWGKYWGGGGIQFIFKTNKRVISSNPLTFKLYLYLDGGKLTIESNEFTVTAK